MQSKLDSADKQLVSQTQRLLQHLNTERACRGEIRQLLSEIFGQQLDDTTHIQIPFYTDYGCNVRLGQHVLISRNVTLSDFQMISIGNDVEIGSETMLLTTSFRKDATGTPRRWTAPIEIKNGVKIGSHVIIQPGVAIGERAIILSGAVIKQNVPADAVVDSP